MIKVIPYDDGHIQAIRALHESQDYPRMQDITVDNLPLVGFIAVQGRVAVAAGFLRQVEGGFAQLDSLVSNKVFPSKKRHAAISLIVEFLIHEARSLGFKAILATTSDDSVLERALKVGFRVIPQTLIGLMLEDVH